MKRFYSRFRIFLLTFTIGLASVFMTNNWRINKIDVPVNLPQTESSSVFEIITKRNWKGFEPIGHGCGGQNIYGGKGAATGYENERFERVSVNYSGYDNSKELEREIALRIGEASKILENQASKNVRGKRLILENRRDDKTFIDVITFENSKSIKIISAKRLELITEFEEWETFRNKQLGKVRK